jgi:hypothetical protein
MAPFKPFPPVSLFKQVPAVPNSVRTERALSPIATFECRLCKVSSCQVLAFVSLSVFLGMIV